MSSATNVLSLICFLVAASHGAICAASALLFDCDFSNTSTFSLADFTTAGDAVLHGGLFDLTVNTYGADLFRSVGRVSYAHPVQLRNSATGEVASFTTAFSFAINITDKNNKGDGMAFFLGGYPPALPPDSNGGALGLCTDYCVNKTAGKDRFVAVEFDTFNDTWDPSLTYDHVGIDVSSIVSVANITLPSFSLNGQMSARVDYNSSTSEMNVELRFVHSPKFGDATPIFNVSAKVDLGTELPEQVAIGFSAANGASVELHQLLSWSFSLISSWSSPGSGMSTECLVEGYENIVATGSHSAEELDNALSSEKSGGVQPKVDEVGETLNTNEGTGRLKTWMVLTPEIKTRPALVGEDEESGFEYVTMQSLINVWSAREMR